MKFITKDIFTKLILAIFDLLLNIRNDFSNGNEVNLDIWRRLFIRITGGLIIHFKRQVKCNDAVRYTVTIYCT